MTYDLGGSQKPKLPIVRERLVSRALALALILPAPLEASGRPLSATTQLPVPQRLAVDHKGVSCAVAERFPEIHARLSPLDIVAAARVVFQGENAQEWFSVVMKPKADVFVAVLPQPKKSLKAFRYYIEAASTALESTRTAEFAVVVVPSSGGCQGKVMAATLATAAVLLQGPAGVVGLPAGFASVGVVAAGSAAGSAAAVGATSAGGGVSGTTLAVAGGAAAGAAALVLGNKKSAPPTPTPTPAPALVIGFRVGVASPGACGATNVAINAAAPQGTVLSGGIGPGDYCVILFNVPAGTTAQRNFTVTVSAPGVNKTVTGVVHTNNLDENANQFRDAQFSTTTAGTFIVTLVSLTAG